MINAIVKKLQYKLQPLVLIAHAPESFRPVLKAFGETAEVHTEPRKGTVYAFIMHFVQTPADVQKAARTLAGTMEPDAVLWMTYPKKSSRIYKSTITRDEGWQALGELGFEPVSLVSVDDDWSALRFRKVDFIKTMTRRAEMALSTEGQKKAAKKK